MAPSIPRRALAALLGGALLASGCHTAPKKPTVSEWLKENTIILEQLRSFDRKERQTGIHRFLKLDKELGKAVVNYLLADPSLDDYRIEVVLARILAEWKDPNAVQYLIRNLRSRDDGAVEIAREGLLAFGDDPRIQDAVGELLTDPEPRPREVAVSILSEMKGPEAVRLLGERLKLEPDREIRAVCLLGVLQSRHPRRTEFLLDAMGDSEPDIRRTAWMALSLKRPPVAFNPDGDALARAQSVTDLRRWAGISRPVSARTGESP